MGKQSKHIKIKDQILAFGEKLRSLNAEIARTTTDNDANNILQHIRDFTKEYVAIAHKVESLHQDQVNQLGLVGSNYMQILKYNPRLITPEDIKNIFAYQINCEMKGFQEFIKSMLPLAISSQLANNEIAQDILITIYTHGKQNLNSFQQQAQEILKFVNLEFLKVASYFHQLNTDAINKNPEAISVIFKNACFISSKNGNINYLNKVINTFKIDVKALKIHEVFNGYKNYYTPLTFIRCIDEKIQENYIKLLCKQYKLHPDSDITREDFDLVNRGQKVTPLMLACNDNNLTAVELLLNYGAKINEVTTKTNGHGVTSYRTAFSMAISTKKIELIEFLLKKGADPMKVVDLFKKDHPSLKDTKALVFASDGKAGLDEEYLEKIYNLTETYYLNSIIVSLDNDKKANKTESPEAPLKTQNDTQARTTKELLESYISFKEDHSSKIESLKNLQDTFDLLLLKFINDKSPQNLENAQKYIDENPKLKFYSVTSLLNINSDKSTVESILEHQQKLLHKYFTIKKTQESTKKSTASEVNDIPDGVYIINSELKNNVYVILSKDLEDQENYQLIKDKVKQKLASCKFIKANSEGAAGIKVYANLIKLKIDNRDFSLSANVKFLSKDTGDILIIFNKVHDHKIKNTKGDVPTIELETFAPIWKEVKESVSSQTTEQESASSQTTVQESVSSQATEPVSEETALSGVDNDFF